MISKPESGTPISTQLEPNGRAVWLEPEIESLNLAIQSLKRPWSAPRVILPTAVGGADKTEPVPFDSHYISALGGTS
jgi:hypothetical protein